MIVWKVGDALDDGRFRFSISGLEPEIPARRVGNVIWRGVPLPVLLARTGVMHEATTVCREGLGTGTFAGIPVERYVKDIPWPALSGGTCSRPTP